MPPNRSAGGGTLHGLWRGVRAYELLPILCAVEISGENMAQVALIGHSKPQALEVKARISKTLSHAVANSWWSPSSLPAWLNEECCMRQIQPWLKLIKVREIAEALGVSKLYAAFIRAGQHHPHPSRICVALPYFARGCGAHNAS
jgi:hypothetical protein